MLGDRGSQRATDAWWVAIGAVAGIAAGLALSLRGRRGWPGVLGVEAARLEDRVREALETDEVLRNRGLEIGVLAEGIVELTGTVRDEAEADRAVTLARRVPGIRTVLNRLDLEIIEDHLADTRRRFAEGEPSLHETHWYGIRVGMGRRRQGHETDPDRPDDRVPIASRELGTDRAIEQTSERLDKLPTGGEGHTSKPAAPYDRGTVGDASHRRLGNVPDHPIQDLNPTAGVHENVKKGTELTLEQAGLEEELIERNLEDRS